MLQACAVAGIEVPHYCYHPKLITVGNCRMCLIEFGTPAIGPDRKPVMNPDGTPKISRSVLPSSSAGYCNTSMHCFWIPPYLSTFLIFSAIRTACSVASPCEKERRISPTDPVPDSCLLCERALQCLHSVLRHMLRGLSVAEEQQSCAPADLLSQ